MITLFIIVKELKGGKELKELKKEGKGGRDAL
jgi:hypothetical protein